MEMRVQMNTIHEVFVLSCQKKETHLLRLNADERWIFLHRKPHTHTVESNALMSKQSKSAHMDHNDAGILTIFRTFIYNTIFHFRVIAFLTILVNHLKHS